MSASDAPVSFTPVQLIVRCFAELKDKQWQAFSIEFGLAAQADTADEVEAKLDSMLQSYVEDALIGEDRAHANILLRRKAPMHIQFRYHYYSLLSRFRSKPDSRSRVFIEPLSLSPAGFPA